MRSVSAVCLSAFLAFSAAGCAALSSAESATPDYSAQAESNLRKGDEAMERRDFEQAAAYFEYVRTKFPYLEVANQAELKLADLEFAREQFPEAREKFQSFIKLHPTHPQVDYAAYRGALTHVEAIPGDFFLLPPSYEKDQTEVRSALRALTDFLEQYPKSSYVPEAQKKVDEVRRRLAEHELYVASFYARRERWKAVAQRLEGLLERYPGSPFEEQAFFDLHNAYQQMNDAERAKKTLERVIQKLPGTPAAERARRMLGT
jgi:outer membrane protein assembly factor BamD